MERRTPMQRQVNSKAEWMRPDVRKGDSAVSACHARTAPAQRGAAGAQAYIILESLAAERMFCHPVPQGDAQLPCQ